MDIFSLAKDPDFLQLPPPERRKAFAEVDPDFAQLPEYEQNKAVFELTAGKELGQMQMLPAHEPGKRIIPQQTESPFRKVARESIPVATATLGGLGGSLASPLAGTVAGGTLGYGIGKAINRTIGLEDEAPAINTLVGSVTLPQGRNQFERVMYQGLGDVTTGLANELTGIGLGAGLSKAGQLTGKGITAIKNIKNPPVEKVISEGIQKGIRPTIVGKRTAPQRQEYMNRAKSAVEDIVNNKSALRYTDEFGEVTAQGRTPETVQEFAQAINQRKKSIFEAYDSLAQSAGGKGAAIDVTPIAKDLDSIINNKVLNDTQPAIVAHARNIQENLLKRGSYTATEAQDAITVFNDILQGAGKNRQITPTANVDAVVVTKLRKALDEAISATEGEGYQALKNQYGALKAIEKDVNNRAGVSGRMSPYGLFDVSNVWTAAQAVKSILSGNILGASEAAAAFATKRYMQKANKADTIIKNMFKRVEKAKGLQ